MIARDKFDDFHPGIQFLFFFAAVVGSMCLLHPAFVLCAVLFSAAYVYLLRGRRAWRVFRIVLVMFTVISLLNPLLNTNGEQVLFTWLGGRPFYLESLLYGMTLGGMSVAVILWFAAYNSVMTSDKFLHLFGRAVPSLSLVLTMILRLIPNYQRKAKQIAGARQCIGMAGAGSLKEQLSGGAAVLSSLTSWALEGGIERADSMRCRGFGTGPRSHFSVYRWQGMDKGLLAGMLLLLAAVVVCAFRGATAWAFVPRLELAPLSQAVTALALAAYAAFLAIPVILNIAEMIQWRSLRSKI